VEASPSFTPYRAKHRGRDVTIILVIVASLAVILILFLVPVEHPFSLKVTSSLSGTGATAFAPPSGSGVSGSWTAAGASVILQITDSLGHAIYAGDGTSGSFSFTAINSPYTVSMTSPAPETVTVTGHYSSPFL